MPDNIPDKAPDPTTPDPAIHPPVVDPLGPVVMDEPEDPTIHPER